MKKFFYNFVFAAALLSFNNGNSQTPTYELTAKNFTFSPGCGYWNAIEFDIYLRSTGGVPLQYALGQYFISFDPAIANGGTLTYEIVNSDLPAEFRPRNPSVGQMSNPAATVLRLASNTPQGSGFTISSDYPGTKVATMRLKTSALEFTEYLGGNFAWRNPPIVSSTKIMAYINGGYTDITTSNTHSVVKFCIETIPWCECRFYHAISISSVLEGLYNPQTNTMNRTDPVTIELRNSNDPQIIYFSQNLFLDKNNLSSYFVFSILPVNNSEFYIVIKHFNSIETWTKVAAIYHENYLYLYDFTDAESKAYGDNLKLVGSKYTIYSGDVNQDKFIDITDVSLIDNDALHFVSGQFLAADLNGDDIVDITDIQIAENNAMNYVSAKTPLD